MWAHYADNHGGVCIGLDADRVVTSCPLVVHGDVRYQDEPFSMKFDPSEDLGRLLRRLAEALLTKDARWSYEQEVRFVTFEQQPRQRAPEAVQSVILGLRATSQTRDTVNRWKELRPRLNILEARRSPKSYDLELFQIM
jgi:hypothetical protein